MMLDKTTNFICRRSKKEALVVWKENLRLTKKLTQEQDGAAL